MKLTYAVTHCPCGCDSVNTHINPRASLIKAWSNPKAMDLLVMTFTLIKCEDPA